MAKLEFKDLTFDDNGCKIKVNFLRLYYFDINKEDIGAIGKFKLDNKNRHSIEFDASEKKATNKFNMLITKGFQNLRNKINNNPTTYIHKNSGVPLIGALSFGIVDKGSSMLEVKPMTGCNMNCIFCSVDEGPDSKKIRDIVVEERYLVEEIEKLLKYKKPQKQSIDVYINPHGEPLLYADIADLVKDISKFNEVRKVIIITNGTLLNKQMIDDLSSTKCELNVSISASGKEKGKEVMGTKAYNLEYVKEMLEYASGKLPIVIAPVIMEGINFDELRGIIEFGKKIGAKIRPQNFQHNKMGRNPVKEIKFDDFAEKIKELEKKYDVQLLETEFDVQKTKEFEKPFIKGKTVIADIVFPGRYKKEKIAVAGERAIVVPSAEKLGKAKLKILKSSHNTFLAKPVN